MTIFDLNYVLKSLLPNKIAFSDTEYQKFNMYFFEGRKNTSVEKHNSAKEKQ